MAGHNIISHKDGHYSDIVVVTVDPFHKQKRDPVTSKSMRNTGPDPSVSPSQVILG